MVVDKLYLNISRTRRLINNGSDKFNDVSLSVIAKIEKTGFTYDMMSINEVFDFPKIWYRRSLARRLFLGEEPSTSNQSQLNRNSQSPQTPFTEPQAQNNRGTFEGTKRSNKRLLHTNNSPSWKTCVLLSVSLSTLDVKMNVGKIMGEITWITKNPVLFSKMSISSFGPREMKFNFLLDGSRLNIISEKHGGIVLVQNISSFGKKTLLQFFVFFSTLSCFLVELNDDKKSLTNVINKSLNKIALRINAIVISANKHSIQTPILKCRLSNLDIILKDTWKVNEE